MNDKLCSKLAQGVPPTSLEEALIKGGTIVIYVANKDFIKFAARRLERVQKLIKKEGKSVNNFKVSYKVADFPKGKKNGDIDDQGNHIIKYSPGINSD